MPHNGIWYKLCLGSEKNKLKDLNNSDNFSVLSLQISEKPKLWEVTH